VIPHEEDPPLTIHIIAPIALFAVGLPSVSHNLMTLTLRTLDFYNSHILSYSMVFATGIILA